MFTSTNSKGEPCFIIRNSDRALFKRCRFLWHCSSRNRLNYGSIGVTEALEFGTAIHAGMEVIHSSVNWENPIDILTAEAILKFKESMDKWRERLIKLDAFFGTKNEVEWNEYVELGKQMLAHYIYWADVENTDWIPVKTEIEFEVPLPLTNVFEDAVYDSNLFRMKDIDGIPSCLAYSHEHGDYLPVYVQGRLDGLFKNLDDGSLWAWDHKTTGQMPNNFDHLLLDTQAGTYYWATRRMLGMDVSGVVFNFLLKDYPKPPAILKSGKVSKNKAQRTTKYLIREAIAELGLNPFEYQDFLNTFEEPSFFHREPVTKTSDELDQIQNDLVMEFMDMYNARIYTHPNMFNCRGCKFKKPCQIRQEGGDWYWYLNNSGMYAENNPY